MKVDFEGTVRDLDLVHITLRHAVAIQEFTGQALLAWQDGLSRTGGAGDIRQAPMFTDPAWITGMAAAHWLMLAQAGEDPPPLDDAYDCDVLGFALAVLSAFAAAGKAKAARPDPTVPPGRRAPSSRRTPIPNIPDPAPVPRTGS